MEELVTDHQTGLHFTPGDSADLAQKMRYAWDNPSAMTAMGHKGRAELLEKYTAATNIQLLMDIYEQTIARARERYGT
jgi:glycosyltransferase involved in cell wall biosynthesis